MQAVQGTSQSKTELLSFSLFLLCFLCFSLSPSTQIIPSISLSSSSKGVGFPVSCSCLPPVPRNPHLPRHIETETPRRAVDTLSAETVHQLLCHHRCFCAGTISFSRKGSCRQTCACCGGGRKVAGASSPPARWGRAWAGVSAFHSHASPGLLETRLQPKLPPWPPSKLGNTASPLSSVHSVLPKSSLADA